MSIIEAIILGLVQGLTEFLPVSSSGHIELGKAILGTDIQEDLLFSILVHLATVLSIFIVFRKDIWHLLKVFFSFKWTDEFKYITFILVSAIPIVIAGLFFKDFIDSLFQGNLLMVGIFLIFTGFILLLSKLEKTKSTPLTYPKAIALGLAQLIAILPGISRSGTTIATGLALGLSRSEAARFSFLMVLIPIIGASTVQTLDVIETGSLATNQMLPYAAGFIAAFASGWAACQWMLAIVKKGNITWFSIYCWIAGAIAMGFAVM